jgi:hypothetical protein
MKPIRSIPKLARIRAEAWDCFPLWRQAAARLVWHRQGYTPAWNLTPVDPASAGKPPFDIIRGMLIYAISADIARAAPHHVLLAIYGCLLAHTSRFWYRSGSSIHTNGNGDVQLLPTWPNSIRVAARYHFAVEHMQGWLASPENPRNA